MELIKNDIVSHDELMGRYAEALVQQAIIGKAKGIWL